MRRALRKTVIGLVLASAPSFAGAADCLVNAHSTARIGAPIKGIIAHLPVERADRVKAGDILAELEASTEDSALALARLRAQNDVSIRLAQRRAETAALTVARQERLSAQNLIPQSDLEQALLDVASARLEEEQARLAQQQAQLELEAAIAARERKRIRAPFDGVVTARLMSPGELYAEQGPIVVLARVDPLHVETYLPLSRLDDVSAGDLLKVTLETGETVSASVSVIDPVLDAATGTFGVRLVLPNPDGAIVAGQSCVVVVPGGG